jgi:translation initiation factor IF-3
VEAGLTCPHPAAAEQHAGHHQASRGSRGPPGGRRFPGVRLLRAPPTRPQPRRQTIAASSPDYRVNDRVRAREVRLIDPDGVQLGIKALPEAMNLARRADLDLVEIAPDANPPVCKIMDYGKFRYETEQRAKESRRKASNTSIKEMKYRVKIGPGDFDTKTRQVGKFLTDGHKVKITIMFRGRENDHPELGMRILDRVAETVAEVAKIEAAPKRDGRNMTMVLAPDRRHQPPRPKAAAVAPGPVRSNELPTAQEA